MRIIHMQFDRRCDMKRTRKTRSDKFPLTLHATGQCCKKIAGRMHYFGKGKKQALERYLGQAMYLHGYKGAPVGTSNATMTLKQLCDLYLEHQLLRLIAGAICVKHHTDQISSTEKLMSFLGTNRKTRSISTLDLQNHKRKLLRDYGSAHRPNQYIGLMKALFHWARRNDVLEHIPNVDAVSQNKIAQSEKYTFTPDQVKTLLGKATVEMRAMIWLGLNCGFGCTDCAMLSWKDVDSEQRRIQLARNKTGVRRNLPLWPETVKALKSVPHTGPLVFYTAEGHEWVRTAVRSDGNGGCKYTTVNAVSSMFARLLKKTRMQVPKGTGFYSLRRTAATLAARSGEPFAVQRLLGHVDVKMATRYVQDVSEQTDRVIESSRQFLL